MDHTDLIREWQEVRDRVAADLRPYRNGEKRIAVKGSNQSDWVDVTDEHVAREQAIIDMYDQKIAGLKLRAGSGS